MNLKVTIKASGHEFDVQDRETVLDAASRAGFVLPYGCRNGACGTCKGRILSGAVDYGDYEEGALSDEEKAEGLALFCQAVPKEDLVIEARELEAVQDIPIKILPCRVETMKRLSHDVMGLYLKLPRNQRLRFLAGQYIDILLRDGRRRSFSLANAPIDDEFLQLQIRLVPGGYFSTHVFEKMKEKDLLRFRGPLGTFFLREDSRLPLIFVAGGTGFAPIKGIIEHIFAQDTKRPMHLFWGVRTKQDLYMHALVSSWERDHALFQYTPVLSEPLPAERWTGHTGWVHEAVLEDFPDLKGYEVYASGPPLMIKTARKAFVEHDLEKDRLYYDSFEFAHDTK